MSNYGANVRSAAALRSAKRRQCPSCGRKSALMFDVSYDGPWWDQWCRWAEKGLCDFVKIQFELPIRGGMMDTERLDEALDWLDHQPHAEALIAARELRRYAAGTLSANFPTDEDVEVALAEERRIYREHDTGRTGPTPQMAMRTALQAVAEARRTDLPTEER